jgi:hypothetical protein
MRVAAPPIVGERGRGVVTTPIAALCISDAVVADLPTRVMLPREGKPPAKKKSGRPVHDPDAGYFES